MQNAKCNIVFIIIIIIIIIIILIIIKDVLLQIVNSNRPKE